MYLDKSFLRLSMRIQIKIGWSIPREAVIHTINDIVAISQSESVKLQQQIQTRQREIKEMLSFLKPEGVEIKAVAAEAPKPLIPPRVLDLDRASVDELLAHTDDLHDYHFKVLKDAKNTLKALDSRYSRLEADIDARDPDSRVGFRPR
jgi:hypothetical protein